MAELSVVYDTVEARFIAKSGTQGFSDKWFIATDSQTVFNLDTNITSLETIDVEVDGRKKREGASYDWTRDTANDRIIFNSGLNSESTVFVRVYTGRIPQFSDNEDTATSGQTVFDVAQNINSTQAIDVDVDGRRKREGASYDYERDVDSNQIIFNAGLNEGSYVHIRVFEE